MTHGFTAVKEQCLDKYAEVFANAGLGVLVYDHRNFGASDGTPRQEIDGVAQARDYRHAVTFACTLSEVDRDRIGIWGTSYSGGHVLVVGAVDRRVRCVVSQAPTINGYENARRRTRPDLVKAVLARFDGDREARFRGEPPMTMQVVAEDPLAPCALSGRDSWEWFQATGAGTTWRNEVTLRSLELAREWEPGRFAERISPTPLLMLVATQDTLTPTDLALDAYARALEPKQLVLVNGGHFAPYGAQFALTSSAARDWFVRHLVEAQVD
jgi:fermentation-respiration switch protein FrsA (DUF1100 family)